MYCRILCLRHDRLLALADALFECIAESYASDTVTFFSSPHPPFECIAESYASDTLPNLIPYCKAFECIAESYSSDTDFPALYFNLVFECIAESYASDTKPRKSLSGEEFECIAESYASDTIFRFKLWPSRLSVLPNPMPQTPRRASWTTRACLRVLPNPGVANAFNIAFFFQSVKIQQPSSP